MPTKCENCVREGNFGGKFRGNCARFSRKSVRGFVLWKVGCRSGNIDWRLEKMRFRNGCVWTRNWIGFWGIVGNLCCNEVFERIEKMRRVCFQLEIFLWK